MTMSETLSLAEVKAHLSELVGRVNGQHERVTVTVHGRPSAVLMAVEDLEALGHHFSLSADRVRGLDAIDPAKDIDGIHPLNAGLLRLGFVGERDAVAEHVDQVLTVGVAHTEAVADSLSISERVRAQGVHLGDVVVAAAHRGRSSSPSGAAVRFVLRDRAVGARALTRLQSPPFRRSAPPG